jgi:hypothetical protein
MFKSDFMLEEGVLCRQCVDVNDLAATTTTSIMWQNSRLSGCGGPCLAAFGKVLPWTKASEASSAAMGSEEVLPGARFRKELAKAAAVEAEDEDSDEDGGADEADEEDEGGETGWKPAYATKADPLSRTFITDLRRDGRMGLKGSESGTHDRGTGFVYRPLDGSITMHHPRTHRSYTVHDPLLKRGSGWRWHITAMANLSTVAAVPSCRSAQARVVRAAPRNRWAWTRRNADAGWEEARGNMASWARVRFMAVGSCWGVFDALIDLSDDLP